MHHCAMTRLHWDLPEWRHALLSPWLQQLSCSAACTASQTRYMQAHLHFGGQRVSCRLQKPVSQVNPAMPGLLYRSALFACCNSSSSSMKCLAFNIVYQQAGSDTSKAADALPWLTESSKTDCPCRM